jgi:prepilin-type processing-associated H-X9-DG protein
LQVENLNTIKQCPSWEGYNPKGITIDRHSIKMNGALCPNERLPETSQQAALQLWYFPRLSQMPQKSRTVLLLDGTMEKPYDTHTDTQIESPHKDVANRHKQGANLLFIDGSSIFVDAKKKKIALGPVGWKHEAGYIWHPYLKPKLFDHE